jgi:Arc/MetJ-type ribon-helix-helix transcriptional regulator
MAARAPRHLTREHKALLDRRIAAGDFRDAFEFEDFAIRRAIAEMQWRELRELRASRPPVQESVEETVRKVRKLRRAVARDDKP